MREKKERVYDAVAATKAALEEGILPGGGSALVHCLDSLTAFNQTLHGDEKRGGEIIAFVLSAPLCQIAKNAGEAGMVIFHKVKEGNDTFGWNALTNEFVDMLEAGIVDPTKVVRSALQNAASVASMLLTTEAVVVELPAKEAAPDMSQAGQGMGY